MGLNALRWLLGMLLLALAGAAPARAEWLRAESDHFIVYGDVSVERLQAQVAQLEEFDRLLRALTSTTAEPAANKLNVYVVRGTGRMREIGNVDEMVAGFYVATPDAILAAINDRENRGANENDILFHEYAHHFMRQYHPAAYPLWYVEGFAEYVMTARIEPDLIEYGNFNRGRASWLAGRRFWLPYDGILSDDAGRYMMRDPARYYAQSWLLVHYLLSDPRRSAGLVSYLRAVGRGEDPKTAFSAAFGMDMLALEAALAAYARRITYHRLTRTSIAATPNVRIERLPASADDLLLTQGALRLGVPKRGRPALLGRVRQAAARHGDAYSRRVLAQAELLYGDADAADRLLDGLLAEAPSDAELLYFKGLRHLIAGRRDAGSRREQFRRAASFFARAHRVDPNHFPTLYRYAESLSLEERFLSENTQNVLLLATALAPQVNEIRIAAAHLLLLREQYAQAETLLLPVATAVHDRLAAERAQELLQRARARQRPENDDVFPVDEAAAAAGPNSAHLPSGRMTG